MSNYLPPFTAEERITITGQRPQRTPAGTGESDPEEVTYADFLGDEVDEETGTGE